MTTTITTTTTTVVAADAALAASYDFPTALPLGLLQSSQKLSLLQAGHLRHFHNLATCAPGEWPHMGTQAPGQEWLDALRYQLSTMTYAAGAAHYHRLPALRSVFKPLFENLITKMLKKDVWAYWYMTSQSGRMTDPDIQELRKPFPPIQLSRRISWYYSGHLLLMVALHGMLFNDDKYDALVFKWNPIFFGMGSERFSYNRTTLQEAILKEMERENWIGVCCEPNCVFVVCNRFPYNKAWKSQKGFLQDDGLFVDFYMTRQSQVIPSGGVGFTAWACTFMPGWNPEEVHALYPAQSLGFITRIPDGRVNVNSNIMGHAIRALVKQEGADPHAPETIRKAREEKRHLQPRYDETEDAAGNWTRMDPYTGNAAIGYARLNVYDGQKKMWEAPWTRERFADAMVLTVRTWDGSYIG
ncbi:hypothetical protein DFH06DRAFT_1275649 [Mycena polygramma]|nr:hypothetical protein DFH06DRAFT_1275649 [Mycena polygramma]